MLINKLTKICILKNKMKNDMKKDLVNYGVFKDKWFIFNWFSYYFTNYIDN